MSIDALKASAQAHQKKLNTQEARQKLETDMNKRAHEANLEELRKSKQQDALNIDSEHHKQIAEKSFEKERKLEQVRVNLEDTERVINTEIERQKQVHQKTSADRNIIHQDNMMQTREKQEMALEDNNHRYNVASRDANNAQKEQTYKTEQRFQHEDVMQNQLWNQKLNERRNNFSQTFQSEGRKFEELQSKQEET